MLQFDSFGYTIGSKQLLDSFSTTITQGELICIIGPNGAGKSTLLSCIAGVNLDNVVTQGSLHIDTQNSEHLSIQERAKLGVFLTYQHPPELQGVTIAQLLYEIKKKDQSAKETLVAMQQATQFLELEDNFYTREVHHGLSGGQKKMAELLQILVLKPKIVLLDEIDTGLDVGKQKILIKTIDEIKKWKGTILMVTHRLELIQQLNPTTTLELKKSKLSVVEPMRLKTIKKQGF